MRALVLTALLIACQSTRAFAPASAAEPDERGAIGPLGRPAASGCTTPDADSLITGPTKAAYVQMCSQIRPGYPTTLNVIDYADGRPKHITYQLRAIRPKLLSIDAKRISWLQAGPDTSLNQGDRPALVELDLGSGQVKRRAEVQLPFAGALMQIDRGGQCTMVRVAGGLKRASLISVGADRLSSIPIGADERVLFWDALTPGFVLAKGATSEARAVDCQGNAVPLSAAVRALLSAPRHKLDRFYSSASARAIAVDPLKKGERARLLIAGVEGESPSTYHVELDIDAIHGVAADSTGERIAVVGGRSVEVVGPAGRHRSIAISKATGWNVQTGFLNGRPALIVLDDLGASIIDLEH